ncbi:hypothetical protein [Paenibacillus cremeus]|uniref:P/Homo B domain-containing protein n=1 Tax=Paenibacillus cremeus TaxID=2163881 RepID=A0A559JNN7_9BACL|nr:hypothetical protein [Paenibacillus cremeus]TVY01497.1 hypothetical protein FPZ49_32385 [Paenibacillus cremeus]
MKLTRFSALLLAVSLPLTACGSATQPTSSLPSKTSTQQSAPIAQTSQQPLTSQPTPSPQASSTTETKSDQSQPSTPSDKVTPTNKEPENNNTTKPSSVQVSSSTTSKETPKTSTEIKTESKQEDSVKILSVSSPAPRNSTATLKAKVAPGATAHIVVHYKSGASTAAGLEPKKADSNGNVSWSWHVGGNTTLGSWRITVSSGNSSAETSFQVVH